VITLDKSKLHVSDPELQLTPQLHKLWGIRDTEQQQILYSASYRVISLHSESEIDKHCNKSFTDIHSH
jgi:hypothetical protein